MGKRKRKRIKKPDPAEIASDEQAKRYIQARTGPMGVLEGLLNNGIDMSWVVEQLRDLAENGGTPVKVGAVKTMMQLMATGGMLNEVNLGQAKTTVRRGRKAKDEEEAAVSLEMIDAAVESTIAQERKTHDESGNTEGAGTAQG